MDPRHRFTRTVGDYARYRPDYPTALITWIAERGPRVVDVGSGTGILARQLAVRGLHVVGVEPNDAMRREAERADGGPRYVSGAAEATGLDTGSANVVVGAQSFHWFALDEALPELERVAAGWVVAAWNIRETGGFSASYDAVLHTHSADYRGVPKAGPTIDLLVARRPLAQVFEVPHHQDLDLAGVMGRAWSSSYVVHGVTDGASFDAAMAEAFDAHESKGRVRIRYHTRWVAWQAHGCAPGR